MNRNQLRKWSGSIALSALLSSLSATALAQIDLEAATRIALARVPGTVTEVERDTELGREVFEVEIRTKEGAKFEVVVAVDDGKILKVEEDH